MQTNQDITYDCAIIGGGLAGLSLAIQLAKKKHSVILFEKNTFPFHKVCGEYISMESWDFINSLGINLEEMELPKINTLSISAHNGYIISSPLAMGGFGISRYTLDFLLAKKAKELGVNLIENCKVNNLQHEDNAVIVSTTTGNYHSKLVAGSYGKYTPHFTESKNAHSNYIGVKYHIKTNFPPNLIELHNFEDGYCGISTVDNATQCLCYLTISENLQKNKNDIKLLEQHIIRQNPHLEKYFSSSTFLFEKPLVISNVTFEIKHSYQNNIFLLGDSAGTIAPLCGNGMSMALRASQILADLMGNYFDNRINKQELIALYSKKWNKAFSLRIKIGAFLQHFFGNKFSTILTLKLLNHIPVLFRKIISLTHGKPFN